MKGKYADESTLLGTAAEIGLAFTPLDVAQDLRDLSYDLTHLKTTPWHQTALDAVALLPVVGGLKYADEAATLLKQGQNAAGSTAAGVISFFSAVTVGAVTFEAVPGLLIFGFGAVFGGFSMAS